MVAGYSLAWPPLSRFPTHLYYYLVGFQPLYPLNPHLYSRPRPRSRSRPYPCPRARSRTRPRSRPRPRPCSHVSVRVYLLKIRPCPPPSHSMSLALILPRGDRVCVSVYMFSTLTDRASIIPSNIRSCQSGTWSAGQENMRGTSTKF